MAAARARHFVNIGAEFGGKSRDLGALFTDAEDTLARIDPVPDPAFIDLIRGVSGIPAYRRNQPRDDPGAVR